MRKVTGYNLINFISQLPKNRYYNYINSLNKGLIKIVNVNCPEGPIVIRRWNPSKGESEKSVNDETISKEMVWRLANAFYEGQPINVDRIFAGSYNTRSVLESLVAHTPQFYFCYPGRIEDIAGHTRIEHGHKHLIWKPDEPHKNGELVETKTNMAISEIPTSAAVYDSLVIDYSVNSSLFGPIDIEVRRRHTQIQIALYLIGLQLNYKTWIAQNDLGISYQDKPLIEHEGVVRSLEDEVLISSFDGAVKAAKYIDCIWIKNNRLIPAVMEVEHTTGVTSGLTRMLNFYKKIPPIQGTRYVIVAPDEDRDRVVQEANKELFKELDIRFFPYSAVEELYVICQRRKLRGITEDFLDCYMEQIRIEP